MSTPEDSRELLHTALDGANTPEDRAAVWHAYLEGGGTDHLNDEADDMRRALHLGTPEDVIRLANQDAASRAKNAAKRFSEPEDRYKLDS